MRIKFIFCSALLAALMLLVLGRASGQKITPKVQLLETGEFHGDEVTAQTGGQWWGLFPTPDGFELLPSVIAVDAVHDPVVDGDNPEKKSGKKVSVNRDAAPIFLLRGADMLRTGPVVTVFREEKNLGNGALVTLLLGGDEYRLKVKSKSPEPADYLMPDTKLLLTSRRTTQVLLSLKEPNDAGWALLWAGDLDGDGKLDLYMDLSNHYNASRRKLFLSTQASGRDLVKEIAEFITVGC